MTTREPSVGRPRSFDEIDVLDRAVDVFWRRGAAGATTRMLETELGLTQSSIYNAFGTKNELLSRSLDRYLERLDAEVVAPLDEPDADVRSLHTFVDAMMSWISTDDRPGCMLLNLLGERGTSDAGVAERARAYRNRLRSAFKTVMGNDGFTDAPRKADVLLAGVLGVNIAARSGAEERELTALAASLHSQLDAWAS